MSLTIEQDLKEILVKIDRRLETIGKNINDLKVGQAEIKGEIKAVEKRLESQEFINRGVLIGLIVAILGGAAKLFGFAGNP